MTFLLTAAALSMSATDRDRHYRDYNELLGGVTAQLRDYMQKNPGQNVESIRRRMLDTLADGPIDARLTPARKKKLPADKVYETGSKSSLIFGKMDYTPQIDADTAYSTASAVALTADGICATNFHVVSDLVLTGALNHHVSGDRMRFVMDSDGKAYPVTAVLAVDPVNDMAIIKVDPCGGKLVPAPVGGDMNPGEKVYCLSHPEGTCFNFTEGIVSNNTRKEFKRTGHTRYNLEVTADYAAGASGGPIFDECGNLVALVSTTLSVYANPQQYRDFQMTYKQAVPVFLIKNCFTD